MAVDDQMEVDNSQGLNSEELVFDDAKVYQLSTFHYTMNICSRHTHMLLYPC